MMKFRPVRFRLAARSAKLAALLAAALLVATALLHGCLNDGTTGKDRGGGTEIPNEVRGTVFALSGLPVVGAEVTLLPAGYVPDSGASTAGIFEAVTDTAGRYAIRGIPDGYYNALFGATGGNVAFRDSIRVTGGAAEVPGDTLRAPGLLTAVVKLRPEDAQRNVVVQVLGTGFFRKSPASQPVELSLPQGLFKVRVSVDIPAVDPVSESVSVTSGASDTLKVTFPTYLYPVLW